MSTTPPPPPPPEDPYPSFTSGSDPGTNGDDGGLDQARPSVAANPGRVLLVVGVVGLLLAILLYNVFFNKPDREEGESGPDRNVATTAPAPLPPPMETPIFTPPPVPEPAKVPLSQPEDNSDLLKMMQARLKSNMLITDGGGSGGSSLDDVFGGNEGTSDDSNSQFQSRVVKGNSKAQKTKATHIGNLHRVIAQGRLIQATLETAINTELPSSIRAIVSRDTYAEAGTEPLIPKGSRLIGQYSNDVVGGQSRVFVIWTRMIRPDGVDVMLGSPLVDQIGQGGIGGQVDNRFQEIFSRSVMASIISIGFAMGVEAVQPGDTSTTTGITGTTQSGNTASTATVNALNRLGSLTDNYLQRFINAKPVILVDQGTKVNVFVNRDLVFPAELVGNRLVN
jgi:type IV secretion system protein VirB10